jgi:hypothetical protein
MESVLSRMDLDFLARRAEILEPELVPVFDERFLRSAVLYDEFVTRLALRVFRETGLAAHARSPATTAEIAERAGFVPERALVPLDWILRMLASHGLVERIEPQGGSAGPVGSGERAAGELSATGQPARAAGAPARYRLRARRRSSTPRRPRRARRRSIPPGRCRTRSRVSRRRAIPVPPR